MAERSIILHAHEVRGVLAGTQTQIRRIIKPQPCTLGDVVPYRYKAGDRLWGRETWAETDTPEGAPVVAYRAGGCIAIGRKSVDGPDHLIHEYAWERSPEVEGWKPSIHMPRWASRIDLEVTGVRVQQLQDISEADAQREGCGSTVDYSKGRAYRDEFRDLWQSINGPGSWDRNDLVRVIAFKRVKPK